jgi:hypothetical protein
MSEPRCPNDLNAEFDALLKRAGVTLPPERRAAAVAGYKDLLGQIALLHGRYSHVTEPANIFRLLPVERL